MKIVTSNEGQLCNRLWSYLFLIAHSLHFSEHIYILDFGRYMPLFQDLSLFPKVHFIKSKKIKSLIRIAIKFYKTFGNSIEFDIHNKKFLAFIDGWEYRSKTLYIEKYRKELHLLFAPNNIVAKKCHSYLIPVKEIQILVGVHIRRCDYKTFFNGLYLYENIIYKQIMGKAQQALTENNSQKVCFLLCSDEKINLDDFAPLDCIQIPDGSIMEDLYGLSCCDYIIGPPSTFSMWASFYGNVPLKIIDHPDAKFSFYDFKVISAVDKFIDGSEFTHVTCNY